MRQVLLLALLLTSLLSNGQTRTITGKVIDDFDLGPIPEVRIQNRDTIQLGTTDKNGEFKIQIPSETTELMFSWIGMEWTSIEVPLDCYKVEVIMLPDGTYHYKSNSKVDRIRKKRFDEIPELHSKAVSQGIFTNTPCYKRTFQPYKPQLDKITKELKTERKRIKTIFNKLEIGDTIQIPFTGSYRSDGTDRTTLTPWAYFTDATKSKCMIEGIITNKDEQNSGYNIEIKITDCKSCKYDTPIIYQGKEMVIGTVFRHNMRILKVSTK
jgi:hypothetical protein